MKLRNTLLLTASLFSFASCNNFDTLNTDPARSGETQPEFLLTYAEKRAADLLYDTYYNGRQGMQLSQYWTGTDKTGESRYLFTSDGLWASLYSGPLMDLEEIKNYYNRHPQESSQHMLAAAEIMKIWIFHMLTDIYVDVPYSQALTGDGKIQPAYDNGKDIYTSLLTNLKTQVDILSAPTNGAIRGDVVANGNATQWIRIANALRLRIAMRMVDAQPNEAKAVIEDAVKNTFTTVDQDAYFPYNVTAATNRFPYNDVDRPLVEFAVTSTLVDYMAKTNDPRLAVYARPDQTTNLYIGKPYGKEANDPLMTALSKPGVQAFSGSAKGYIITYAEVAFIKAEAAARGFNVGTATAEELYKEAVTASMKQWGITDAKIISTYLEGVPYKGGTWKNVIGSQKWLALYMQGMQGWLERLRLDPKKPDGTDLFVAPVSGSLDSDIKDGVVKRLKYPSASRAANTQNVESASKRIGGDSQATKNWWDIN